MIPHINTGHTTHKYLVLTEDADKFLERMETDQKLIAELKGKFSNRKNHQPKPFFDVTEENCSAFAEWLEKRWAEFPNALPTLTAAQISGYKAQRIRELIKENVIMGISVNGTQYIPKSDFIAYLSKPKKLASAKTEIYKELIREFKKRQARE